jgi:MFS transporter, FSR family, fosmidomycin resistance protein
VFGAREAAWPLIRTDLRLSYVQIGLLLTLPSVLGALVAPAIGILGDSGHRRRIVLGGGVAFVAGLAATSAAWGFGPFLGASLLLWLASGAFVSLSQASLMDLDPAAHERNMARWTAAGSVGVLIGPLALAGGAALMGWRGLMMGLAVLTIPFVLAARRLPHGQEHSSAHSFGPALRRAARALRRRDVLRWLVVLELTDLLGDVFYGYLALYFVDVVGVNAARAALSVAVWSGAGLVGDWLIIPMLARVDGLRYLRFTAGAMLLAYPAFLLAPGLGPKLGLLALVGLLHAGWYAIPKGRLFTEMSGASGATVALTDLSGLVGRLSPAIIGLVAQRVGLGPAMWGPIVAPLALLVGLPRRPAGTGAIRTSSPAPRD